MAVSELLCELGAKTGLGALDLDENGVCRLVFDGDLTVEIEAPPGGTSFWIAGTVGRLPDAGGAALCRELLAANLMGRGTGGGALAVDPDAGDVVLCQRLDSDRTDFPLFECELEGFLNALDAWKERLGRGGSDAATAEAAPVEPAPLAMDGAFVIRG